MSVPKGASYLVTVERRGVSPLEARLLVRATSPEDAGALACWLAERDRGGWFEATHIRRSRRPHRAFDDTGL